MGTGTIIGLILGFFIGGAVISFYGYKKQKKNYFLTGFAVAFSCLFGVLFGWLSFLVAYALIGIYWLVEKKLLPLAIKDKVGTIKETPSEITVDESFLQEDGSSIIQNQQKHKEYENTLTTKSKKTKISENEKTTLVFMGIIAFLVALFGLLWAFVF